MPIAEAFYEAAIIPNLWKNALNLASNAWEADGITIGSFPDSLGGLICSRGVEELCARYVAEEWFRQDIRATRGIPAARKGGDLLTDFDLLSAGEMERTPYYSAFLERSGFRWFAGAILGEVGGATITLSVDRRIKSDPFSHADLARIRQDLPHLRRAVRLAARGRLAFAEGIMESSGRFACGGVLINRVGQVIQINRKAETYLGQDLQIVSSRLRSANREANRLLQNLISAITRPVFEVESIVPASVLLPRTNDLPLIVSAYPVVRQASDVFQGARGILLITDPSEHRPAAPEILQEVFKLTPAELRVAGALLQGLDTQQIAEDYQVGAQTIRFHLKSIFAKTGTCHQAQLVSLLSRFSANPIGTPPHE